MLFLYVYLIDKGWTELSDDDKINGKSVSDFCISTKNLKELDNDFVEIIKKDYKNKISMHYVVHKSSIQLNYVEKMSNL